MAEVTYENVRFKLDDPLAKNAEIQATEKHIGFPFPADYRDFLLKVNGGRILEDYVVRVEDMDEDVMIGTLFSIGWACDIVATMNDIMATIPKGIVVFGNDPGNNKFLMDLTEDASCPIYFWETRSQFRAPDPEKKRKKGNAFHVADSFTEFLGMFRVFVDEESEDETDDNDDPIVVEPPAPKVKLPKLKSAKPMAEKPAKATKPPKKST
jgi:hypothetical protein